MVKKLFTLLPILFCVLFFEMTGKALADPADQLKQANAYKKSGQYEQAEAIYQQIVRDNPGTEDAFQAQRNLPCVYIAMDKQADAQVAFEKMLADFSKHEHFPHAVHEVVRQCRKLGKADKAKQLCSNVLTNQPESEQAIWAQMGVAISNNYLGGEAATKAAIEKLIAEFSEDNRSAEAVGQIAWSYRILKKYERAKQLYQYVVDNWAYKERAIFSQRGVAHCNIALGDETAAWTAIEKLLTQFSKAKHVAEAVYPLAQRYRKVKKYEKARQLYQYVVDNHPESEQAIWAQGDLVELNIKDGDDTAAQAAIEKLLTQFSGRKGIATTIVELADKCRRKFGKYDKARELYQYVLAHWPDDEYAMWARRGIAFLDIKFQDYEAAEAAIEKILADYPQHKSLAHAFYWLGNDYRRVGKYQRAIELYQYVVDNWPDSQYVMQLEMDAAELNIVSLIESGDDPKAQAALDKLIADFNDHSGLPRAIFHVGEEYYNEAFRDVNQGLDAKAKDHFTKATAVWERIVTELPPSAPYTARAYNFGADCYRRLGQHQKAIEYYQRVVDDWPDYEYAWNALLRIGHTYENLKTLGVTSKSEADPKIKAAYELLLEKYPNCKAAKIAQRWLKRHKTQ